MKYFGQVKDKGTVSVAGIRTGSQYVISYPVTAVRARQKYRASFKRAHPVTGDSRRKMTDSVHSIKLPAPREVSPLIRTARWGLLAVGILYGALRLKYLKSREVNIQKRNNMLLAKRAAEYKQWFEEQAEKSARQLAKDAAIRADEDRDKIRKPEYSRSHSRASDEICRFDLVDCVYEDETTTFLCEEPSRKARPEKNNTRCRAS
ncbi:ATP synthase E chain, partial [Opisthorchis viverrini]